MKKIFLIIFLMLFSVPVNAKVTILKEWSEKISGHKVNFAHICIDGYLWLWSRSSEQMSYPPSLTQVFEVTQNFQQIPKKCNCGE